MLKSGFVWILLSSVLLAQAQWVDTIQLAPVAVIHETRWEKELGLQATHPDSLLKCVLPEADLAVLLSKGPQGIVRHSGRGGIATIASSGLGSLQSAVLWNGIKLAQPSLGMADISRIAAFQFDDISLVTGGSSSIDGSATVGGSLRLENRASFASKPSCEALLSTSNLLNQKAGLRYSLSSRKLAFKGSFFGQWDQNRFQYLDYNHSWVWNRHARVLMASAIQQWAYKLAPDQMLDVGLWYQVAGRQLPVSKTAVASSESLRDASWRMSARWRWEKGIYQLDVNSALITDRECYSNEVAQILSHNDTRCFLMDIGASSRFLPWILLGAKIEASHTEAYLTNYSEQRVRNQAALLLLLSMGKASQLVSGGLGLRAEAYQVAPFPVLPRLSFSFRPWRRVVFNAAASLNYRIPTLNDLYWVPGGNPDLAPEKSFNIELGGQAMLLQIANHQLDVTVTAFRIHLHDYILWVPVTAGISSPTNVAEVMSRGVMLIGNYRFRTGKNTINWTESITFNPSEYRQAENPSWIHQQLMYSPRIKSNGSLNWMKDKTYLMIGYLYNGGVNTTADGQSVLDPYILADLHIGTSIKVRGHVLVLGLSISNVFNRAYETMPYFPEAGREFTLNLQYKFK